MMTIKQGSLVLATGSAAASMVMGPLRVNGVGSVQVAATIRSLTSLFLDRVSKTLTVSFTIAHWHATHRAARKHQMQHRATVANVGDLIVQLTEDGVTHTYTFAAAGWTVVDPTVQGVMTTTSYQVSANLPSYSSSDGTAEGVDDFGNRPFTTDSVDCLGSRSFVSNTIPALTGRSF